MRLLNTALALTFALGGCGSHGSLVVVTVQANPPLSGVARVHVTASAENMSRDFDLTASPSSTPFTFGIDFAPSARGTVTVHVDCSDANNMQLGVGDGSGTIAPGARSDMTVMIGSIAVDMGADGPPQGCTRDTDCINGGAKPCGGTCNPQGVCIYPDSTITCGVVMCSGSPAALTPASTCNGAGDCINKPAMTCQAPVDGKGICAGQACDFACNSGFTKSGGDCVLTWTQETISASAVVEAIGGISATDIYAVGDAGLILHSNGNGTWTQQTSNSSAYLNGFWGYTNSGVYHAFVVGSGGTILENTVAPPGTANWQAHNSGTTGSLSGIWGSSYIFVTSRSGFILHSPDVGQTWVQETSGIPANANLLAIWGSAGTDIYAVGYVNGTNQPLILHSQGAGTWVAQSTGGVTTPLHSVWGSGPNDVYVAGTNGVLLHSTGNGQWSQETSNTQDTMVVASFDATHVYAAGFPSGGSTAPSVILTSSGDGSWQATADPTAQALLHSNAALAVWAASPTSVFVGGVGMMLHGQ